MPAALMELRNAVSEQRGEGQKSMLGSKVMNSLAGLGQWIQ